MTEIKNDIFFEEKQYLGFNKFNLTIRIVLAIFSFLTLYSSNPGDPNADLFLYIGILVLILSLGLIFILHIHTRIENGSITISGFWQSRMVKINLDDIRSCKKIKYSKFLLNRPVYNLHLKGKVRFFTRGNDAVKMIDKDGLYYIIGTQRAEEMTREINKYINTTH
jgi:hypothetical protein